MTRDATLVVGPSWVGDMVMAQSLFKLLRERYPGQPIDVLAPAWSLPLIARMPEIRRGIPSPFAHGELAFRKRWQLGQWLRAAKYARAIVLPRSLKAALVPWFAGIRRRTGYRGEMRFRVINDMRELDKAVLDQTVKRFVALGLAENEALPELPLPQLTVNSERQRQLVSELGLATQRPRVALLPGAEYGPAKCWPLEYFASLAGKLHDAGKDVWILGGPGDVEAGITIAAGSDAINLCGRTELADAVDLLALCDEAVSNDSGLMHVAAATGVAVSAIYGSSSPAYTPPLAGQCEVHYLGISCSPCFKRNCPLQHLRCLREIEPETVFAAMQSGDTARSGQSSADIVKKYLTS